MTRAGVAINGGVGAIGGGGHAPMSRGVAVPRHARLLRKPEPERFHFGSTNVQTDDLTLAIGVRRHSE
jgi:hypothetical protein